MQLNEAVFVILYQFSSQDDSIEFTHYNLIDIFTVTESICPDSSFSEFL